MGIDRHVVAVALAGLVTLMSAGACSSGQKNASADVTVSRCEADPGGGRPSVDGEINNHSSKASTYAFNVTFTDSAGNKVSNGAVSVARVDPGATARWHADGVASAKGPLQCKVGNVVRTAVP